MQGCISTGRGLLALCATALAVRVIAIAITFDAAAPPFTYEHGEIAQNLVSGAGFSVRFLGAEGPTSQQAPLYPLMLAACYQSFGLGTNTALLAMQLAQAVAGSLTALLLAALCWSLLPARRSLGWIAGWIAALHPTQVYSVVHLQVAVWATFALVLATTCAVAIRAPRGRQIAAAMAAGTLLLIEPILVVAIPLLGWLAVRHVATQRRRMQLATLFATCTLAVIAPWLWRNARTHGELVFVKSTFGYAFWQGNNSLSWGTDKIPKASAEALRNDHDGTWAGAHQALWKARHETLYIDNVALTSHDYLLLGAMSEPARSRELMRRARGELTATRYAQLCTQRLRYFFTFDATTPKAAHWLYRASTVAWLATSAVGLYLLRREWRCLWPLAAVFAVVAMFHVMTITAPRFRLPVETLTYVWSAAPIAAVAGALAARGSRQKHRNDAQKPQLRPSNEAFRQRSPSRRRTVTRR